ncbi:Zn-dependent hydrolase [Sphaerisporangium rubeum]|uniref:N-carbamoyl-L-amino-acid hydrolase n=1 Tax=Sphaerisporangium rubeum TaxID=321317 RepID=A0A7X0IIZ7_9ACTN|nr:Zn-dependent hydrolase [Sphaerisporangium rubeum]MBB6474868.1 N-carbamoyl-L-amino-acid hydrolase [Sphaerisporangium rubeum]
MTVTSGLRARVDGTRLLDTLDRLRQIGALPGGGLSRLAFGEADVRGRELVAGLMREAGMRVRVDPAANLIGGYPGRRPGLGALVLGSHLDTVPGGGAFDGAYGVLAAVEVVRTLNEHRIMLDHPVKVVAFSDEEGTAGARPMFGSRAVAGEVDPAELSTVARDGRTLGALVDAAGGHSSHIGQARWAAGSIAAYLELHVEQGPVLEAEGLRIGVVEGISGRCSVDVTVRGETNHGGTTPMELRKDALVAAARVVLAVSAMAGEQGLVRVATTGACAVRPGTWNVIPGEVRLTVDLRDVSAHALEAAVRRLRSEAAVIAAGSGTSIDVEPRQHVAPAPCDAERRRRIEEVARDLGLSHRTLPSGAGHDAQWMARLAPIGMIFVPSRGGVSHAAGEWTDAADLINGAEVLLGCVLAEGTRE